MPRDAKARYRLWERVYLAALGVAAAALMLGVPLTLAFLPAVSYLAPMSVVGAGMAVQVLALWQARRAEAALPDVPVATPPATQETPAPTGGVKFLHRLHPAFAKAFAGIRVRQRRPAPQDTPAPAPQEPAAKP